MPGYALLSQPWWISLIYLALLGHITNVCVTLYLHRSATHGGVKFHPVAEHFMRAWLWLTTGMKTQEWVAVHRKHHAFSDRGGDPHSPAEEGLWAILLAGVFFYRRAATDPELVEKYGKGCPDDWIERRVYTPHPFVGLMLMLVLTMYLFGLGFGFLVWSGMAIWVPIMGNIINGAGHALGYRNFETKDESHNLHPVGFWIVGEELHNNHHADPRSAKFKARWWEFDIGWVYIRLLRVLRLAQVIYARSVSAKEFAGQYYQKNVAQPVTTRLGWASTELERAKAQARERLEHASAEFEHARTLALARIEHMRTHARTEVDEAIARLEDAAVQARSALEDARKRVERVTRSQNQGLEGV